MAYSWTNLTSDEILSGAGAKTTGQKLYEQGRALLPIRRTTLHFPEQSTSSSSYVTLDSQKIMIPSYVAAIEEVIALRARLRARRFGGGTSVDVRLKMNANLSAASNTTNTSYVVSGVFVLAIDAGWVGTSQLLEVQARANGGGTAFVTGEDIMANLWYDSV